MNVHKYRFGVNGKYLRTLFPRRIKRTKRAFPKYRENYIEAYYIENRIAGYISFVGH